MKKLSDPKIFLPALDVLLLLGILPCRLLATWMLAQPGECSWAAFGGQCVSCGGTHFVEALLSGQFASAWNHNPFFFLVTLGLLASLVLLHLDRLCGIAWAQKLLKKIFSIPGLIVFLAVMLVFFFARNIPVFVNIAKLLKVVPN